MKLDIRSVRGVSVLDLTGKLTRGDGDDLLMTIVDDLLRVDRGGVLVNLEKVPYMDSAGIGALMSCRRRAAAAGSSVKLLNPLKRVYDVLQMVKLDTVFEIFQEEAAALDSFPPDRSPP